jgi:gamma-glutamylaminecyclotransferase
MCVIIIKKDNRLMPRDIAKASSRINPHGLGVVWLDTYEVSYHKSSEYEVIVTDRPFIAHFRYATVGKIGLENTHPFECGNNKNELLMMNGTIKDLGNANECDTKVLARDVLGNVSRRRWKSILEEHASRFVTINKRNRTYQIYNRHMWTEHEGIMYSKDNVLERNLVAVYGTLRKGNGNYYRFLSDSKYIGQGYTKDKYPLIIQGLPYLVDQRGFGHNVEVDVFKVSDEVLWELDSLEGHPKWYERKQIDIKRNGKTLKCWIYFNNMSIKGHKLHKKYTPSIGLSTPAKPSKKTVAIPATLSTPRLTTKPRNYELFDEWESGESNSAYVPMESSCGDEYLCPDCYCTLTKDSFTTDYYCQHCFSWHTRNKVIGFNF